MAESSKEPGVTRAPFELALETQRPRCFVSSLVLAPRLFKGLLGINFNPKMFACCLLIALCALVGLVGLVCAANNGSEAWEVYLVPTMGFEHHGKVTPGHVPNCHTRAMHATRRVTATNFKIGMKPSLVRM